MLRSRFGDRFKTAQGTVRNAHGVATSLTGMDIAGLFPWELGRPPRRRRESGVDVGYRRLRGTAALQKPLAEAAERQDRDGALAHCNGQRISRGQAPLEILRNGGSDQGAGMIELERKPQALAVEMQFFAKQLVLK